MFTSEAGLGTGVVNQQSGQEAQHVLPVDLVGFQNLLQVAQQQLHAEEHSQLYRHTDESPLRLGEVRRRHVETGKYKHVLSY